MMVRSRNPCPYRRFSTGHGTVLPNPAPGRPSQRQSMAKAGATALYNICPAAPTTQTVAIKAGIITLKNHRPTIKSP